MLPQSIQFIGLANRSLSEGNVLPIMPRNNSLSDDDEEFDESNDPNRLPPLSTSSEPIIRTFKGNYIKHDNVYKTNISSYNEYRDNILNCFNNNYSSIQSLCLPPPPFLA